MASIMNATFAVVVMALLVSQAIATPVVYKKQPYAFGVGGSGTVVYTGKGSTDQASSFSGTSKVLGNKAKVGLETAGSASATSFDYKYADAASISALNGGTGADLDNSKKANSDGAVLVSGDASGKNADLDVSTAATLDSVTKPGLTKVKVTGDSSVYAAGKDVVATTAAGGEVNSVGNNNRKMKM